jgi:transcriptional regulator with XRE-family HTH domain
VAEGETMGTRLRRLRQEKGMSQPQLAAAAGVPVGTLRNWEQDRRVPLLDTAARVAGALGISLDVLAGAIGGPPGEEPEPTPKRPPGRPKRPGGGGKAKGKGKRPKGGS